MRMKAYFLIGLIAVFGVLSGCRPRETTVNGQVFIVTRGAENIKLGAVEVLLIERAQVTDFLHHKQDAIDSVLISRQRDLAAARDTAQKAQEAFSAFLQNGGTVPNADFVRIETRIKDFIRKNQELTRQLLLVDAQLELARRQGNFTRADALMNQEQARRGLSSVLVSARGERHGTLCPELRRVHQTICGAELMALWMQSRGKAHS